jgi:hypothetical protein
MLKEGAGEEKNSQSLIEGSKASPARPPEKKYRESEYVDEHVRMMTAAA